MLEASSKANAVRLEGCAGNTQPVLTHHAGCSFCYPGTMQGRRRLSSNSNRQLLQAASVQIVITIRNTAQTPAAIQEATKVLIEAVGGPAIESLPANATVNDLVSTLNALISNSSSPASTAQQLLDTVNEAIVSAGLSSVFSEATAVPTGRHCCQHVRRACAVCITTAACCRHQWVVHSRCLSRVQLCIFSSCYCGLRVKQTVESPSDDCETVCNGFAKSAAGAVAYHNTPQAHNIKPLAVSPLACTNTLLCTQQPHLPAHCHAAPACSYNCGRELQWPACCSGHCIWQLQRLPTQSGLPWRL